MVVLDSEMDNAFKKHRNPGWRSRVPVFLKATKCMLHHMAIFWKALMNDLTGNRALWGCEDLDSAMNLMWFNSVFFWRTP